MRDFAAVMRHIRELREDVAGLQAGQRQPETRPFEKVTGTADLRGRLWIHAAIRDTFNEGELRVLAMELGVSDDLEGGTHTERCLSLALYMQRHGRFGELLARLSGERPHVDWMVFE